MWNNESKQKFRSRESGYTRIVREGNIVFVVKKKNRYVIGMKIKLKYLILSSEILGLIE